MAEETGLSSHSVDIDLSRVRSFEKKQELLNILHSEHPDHYSRLWMVGFLRHVGYSQDEICALINKEASWSDYDATMTYCQVRSVFRGTGASSYSVAKPRISSPARTWIKHSEWVQRYSKRMCTLHFVSCAECPDNLGVGKSCKGRI